MRFHEAMKLLEEGKKVRCKEWVEEYFISSSEENLSEGMDIFWFHEKEWELYEEPKKTYTFAEVVRGLKEGKKFTRKGWGDVFVKLENHMIFSYTGDACLGIRWFSFIEDLEATDWVEVV